MADSSHSCGHPLNVLYINHESDVRETEKSDENVTTHNSTFGKLTTNIDTIKASSLADVDIEDYQIIGIDEGQFFSDIENTVRDWVLNDNKIIYISSLDGTSNINVGNEDIYILDVLKLIPLCRSGQLNKLEAKCFFCMKRGIINAASYSKKIAGDSKKTKEIGGDDMYVASCLHCHQLI